MDRCCVFASISFIAFVLARTTRVFAALLTELAYPLLHRGELAPAEAGKHCLISSVASLFRRSISENESASVSLF